MFGTREEFRYFQCSACSCLQIADIPGDLRAFYPSNYYSYHNAAKDLVNHREPMSFLQRQRCRNALFGRGYKLNQVLKRFVALPLELREYGPMLTHAKLKGFSDAFLDIGCGENSWWLEELRRLDSKTSWESIHLYWKAISTAAFRF